MAPVHMTENCPPVELWISPHAGGVRGAVCSKRDVQHLQSLEGGVFIITFQKAKTQNQKCKE